MSFISIPCKKTYEVDLIQPLRQCITSTTNGAINEKNAYAISEFQKLRSNAVCRQLGFNETSLEALYRYYDQLVAVQSKLPFDAIRSVKFKWDDVFDKGTLLKKATTKLRSCGFERACVLFNVGALQSQVAAAQNIESGLKNQGVADVQTVGYEQELKVCTKLFQQSAGTFMYLRENIVHLIDQEATTDLAPDTLSALSALMLAQAQEVFYLKSARDRLPSSLIARIANQTAKLYVDALKQMTRDQPTTSLWKRDWLSQISAKQAGFKALSHYHQSFVAKDAKEYGVQIAHLQRAQELLGTDNAAKVFTADVIQVQQALVAAKKDNEIYGQRVPEMKNVPPIDKVELAKPMPPTTQLSAQFKDLFGHLIHAEVQKALATFEKRKLLIVDTETRRLREAIEVANRSIVGWNLMAMLEEGAKGETFPTTVKQRAEEMRGAGGCAVLEGIVAEMPSLLMRNQEILGECIRLLTEEQESDDRLRAQFKERWTRLASERLTEPLWQEVGKHKLALETAAGASAALHQQFDANRHAFEQLSKPEAELVATLPRARSGADATAPAVERVRLLLARFEGLKGKMQALEAELQVDDQKFDMVNTFVKALAESGALDAEAISTDRLDAIYKPLRKQVSKHVEELEQLMKHMRDAKNELGSTKGFGGVDARGQFMRQLEMAADLFGELLINGQKGTKFYNDVTPILLRTQQKINDFCFARKTEKQDLMKEIQLNITSTAGPK